MPKFPAYAQRNSYITGSVFEKFRSKMIEQGDNMVALHIGDSYAAPVYDLPIDAGFIDAHPGFNRYCDTFGILPLREAIAEKSRNENQLDIDADQVMLTVGASNALAVAMQTLVDPGDEVMIIAPYWPFFRGMVRVAGGTPVEVPLCDRLYHEPDLDIAARLGASLTDKTAVLYVNSPNNPSGKVLTRAQLQQVADFAKQHSLWLVSDEAYDGMVFDGLEHHSPAAFPGMAAQTLSIFSFSKVYMFAGLRLGYVIADHDVIRNLNKTMVHMLYGPSTLSQMMMVEPVRTRSEWAHSFTQDAQFFRDLVMDGLNITPPRPEGSYFLFFPVEAHLNGRSYDELIEQCLDAGVSVAPGADFGDDYAQYIRICFAGEPRDRLELAIERLNKIFPA